MMIHRYSTLWRVALCLLFVLSNRAMADKPRPLNLETIVAWWKQEGRTLSRVNDCELIALKSDKHLALEVQSSCPIEQLVVYTLIRECRGHHKVKSVAVQYAPDLRYNVEFAVSESSCALVGEAFYAAEPHYVLQFYSGKSKPNVAAFECAEQWPLYVNKIDQTYYVFSKVFQELEQAKLVSKHIKKQCPNQAHWVRPVFL